MGRRETLKYSRVHIAIVSYRTPGLAERCLASIPPELGATAQVIETGDKPPVTPRSRPGLWTYAPRGTGYAAALQIGYRDSDRPILIAMNADTEFPADEPVGPLLELFGEHPRLGALGPRQRNPRGFLVHAGVWDPGSAGGGRSYGQADTGQHREPFASCPQISGSIMFLRRAALEQIGGFGRMPHLYYEDALLCHRLREHRWTVAYSGLATFLHHVAASPTDSPGDRAAMAADGRAAWLAEHGVLGG